jgi:uncharacterized protein (DUF1697 family)
MQRYIAFLRAINVGGRNVTMSELRTLFEGLGLKQVESFIASGNLIFRSGASDVVVLQQKIEGRLLRSLGYEVKTFLRTAPEVVAISRYEAFEKGQLKTATAINVAFLADPLTGPATKSVLALRTELDEFHVNGREVYWLCRARQSDSTFSNVRFEKLVGTRATWRNMNTVVRLAVKYGAVGESDQ